MAMTETSLRQPLRFSVDLHDGLFQKPIRPQLMKGDRQANMVIVSLTENKKPIDLTGVTASGSFISPMDRAEIPLTGEVEGSEARVTLVDECYAEDGHFELDIKLTLGGTARTILSITGEVLNKGSGAIIDVGDVIPSIDDIIAQYAEMKRVTDNAQAAAGSASAATENANTAAENANIAAAKINNMTVSAEKADEAGAVISEVNGAKHIAFKLPKGDKGDKGDPGTIENVTISSIDGLPEALDQLSEQMTDYWKTVYPVGSVYMSVSSTSPASLLGGTWEQLKDRFLLGAGDSYATGATGGEEKHTLTVSEMPSHGHAVAWSSTGAPVTGGNDSFDLNEPVVTILTQSTEYGAYYHTYTKTCGSGASHNNMPPYLAVYMWKRVS